MNYRVFFWSFWNHSGDGFQEDCSQILDHSWKNWQILWHATLVLFYWNKSSSAAAPTLSPRRCPTDKRHSFACSYICRSNASLCIIPCATSCRQLRKHIAHHQLLSAVQNTQRSSLCITPCATGCVSCANIPRATNCSWVRQQLRILLLWLRWCNKHLE